MEHSSDQQDVEPNTSNNPRDDTLDTEGRTNIVTFDSKTFTNQNNTTLDATTQHANSSSSSNQLESSGVSTNNSSTDFLSSTTFTDTDVDKSRNITKELIVKKQLMHDIQKLKIELSQKNLLIDTMKADHSNIVDDIEEKLSDAIHQKQLMQAKFETQMCMMQNSSTNEIQKLRSNLQESVKFHREYQTKYEELQKTNRDVKASFQIVDLDEEQYLSLKGKSVEQLEAWEYFSLKLYDQLQPLRIQIETLEQQISLLTSELRDKEDALIEQKKLYEDENHKRNEVDLRCQHFQLQLEDLNSRLSKETYQSKHFDSVLGEKDSLERQSIDLEKACNVYKAELETKVNELDLLRAENLELIQNQNLLKQDKEYLTKQLNEMTPRYNLLQEKLEQTTRQLDGTKEAREELYEKYLNSREQYKQEYETRLKRELDDISIRTSCELEKIKESSKEMYERENRNLRESKEYANAERERLANCEQKLQSKYDQLLGEFRQLQIRSDSKTSECQNETKLKAFELDRIQLLYQESLATMKEYNMKNDVLSNKLDTLNKEYYALTCTSEKRISELEGKNSEYRSKLTIYEKLEQELDNVVMQAAEISNDDDAERVLFSYGYGANIPSTAKRRMQQSVQLARRVLHLERANSSLSNNIEMEVKKTEQLSQELKKTTGLLNEAQQPYNYLIGSIQTRDEQNSSLKNMITSLQVDLEKVNKENCQLKNSNNQLNLDLERLLNQKEEMGILKQMLLKDRSNVEESMGKSTNTSSLINSALSRQVGDINTVKAKPVTFTNSTPNWFEKLRNHNQRM